MKRARWETNWHYMRGKVKEQWGRLTDDDLDRIGGKVDELIGRIQNRYRLAREEAERSVREWNARNP